MIKKIMTQMLLINLFVSFSYAEDYSSFKNGLTTVSVVNENLYLLGTFDDVTAQYVIKVLENNPQVQRIVLTANGGSINDQETLRLGRYIRSQRLDTHLISGGVAASGGVSLLLSGYNRSVGENVFVGVHAWASCSGKESQSTCRSATEFERDDDAHDLHRDYIQEMLGEDGFYWHSIESASHDSIHWLSEQELKQFNVINSEIETPLMMPFGSAFESEYTQTCHNCPSGQD